MGLMLALWLGAAARCAVTAQNWVGSRPPELAGNHLLWFNGPPRTLAGLKGKVVLLDIWDGTCVNCLRTLPYLRAWNRRYAADGLVIIGIHCPEFDFEKDPAIVREFIAAQQIPYPVVADNEWEIWNAFRNSFWPREWLIDHAGIIRSDHAGEGDYGRTEATIQRLLRPLHPGRAFPPLLDAVRPEDAPGAVCYPRSAEMYLGSERGTFGGPGTVSAGSSGDYRDAPRHREGVYYLRGRWESLPQSIRSMGGSPDGALLIRFHGTEVNVVLRSERSVPLRVRVRMDGRPLDARAAGPDVEGAMRGDGHLVVRQAGMFRVIRLAAYGAHELELAPEAPGLHAYAFTFGSCLVAK